MNKEKKALLEKCEDMTKFCLYTNDIPLLGGIYIVPTRYKHPSGYKIMYIVGHTPRIYEEEKLYLLSTVCDVVDFDSWLDGVRIKDLHVDITMGGIIHIWSNRQYFRCDRNGDICRFEMVEKYEKEESAIHHIISGKPEKENLTLVENLELEEGD